MKRTKDRVIFEGKKYDYYRWKIWGRKYVDIENIYKFGVLKKGRNIINAPIKVIYDRNLTYSEKLSIIWNISLKEKLGRQPKQKEIEKESGISVRTVRKAKKKYPQLFSKDYNLSY